MDGYQDNQIGEYSLTHPAESADVLLFASLIPLESRLVKKLTTPLVNLIESTPAMSLLYECIHGIINGGLLENQEDGRGKERIASLCISRLRGMIVVDGDPNREHSPESLSDNRFILIHGSQICFTIGVQQDCSVPFFFGI